MRDGNSKVKHRDGNRNRERSRGRGQAEVVVYTLPFCGYCAQARTLLNRHGVAFREVNGAGTPDFRRRLASLTGGSTVPQIVIDGEPIGGASELARLDRLGLLPPLLARAPFPVAVRRRRLSLRSLARWLMGAFRRDRRESPFQTHVVWLDRSGRAVLPERQDGRPARSEIVE